MSNSRRLTSFRKICGVVRFVPNRPREILSAGYDSTLLHFDTTRGSVLSRFDIGEELVPRSPSLIQSLAGLPPSSGVSLSPPFVHCIAFSEHGAMAASTADGRVWVGRGGDKSVTSKKKRSRKWEGLREDEGYWISVAEGPVVSVYVVGHFRPATGSIKNHCYRDFVDSEHFTTCTLLGSLSQYQVGVGPTEAGIVWSRKVEQLEKVNCMRQNGSCIAVGGFSNGGKGLVEVYGL